MSDRRIGSSLSMCMSLGIGKGNGTEVGLVIVLCLEEEVILSISPCTVVSEVGAEYVRN